MKNLLVSIIILVLAVNVYAQREWTTNWAFGPHLSMSFPQSDFADISKMGEGLGAKVFYRINSLPFFLTRCDMTYLSFGEKRQSFYPGDPYSPYVQVRTESFQFLLGPQFATSIGRVSLYLAPMGGLYYFRTIETIPYYSYYSYSNQYYSETTNSLRRFGWTINSGLMIDLGFGPHIDLELRYQNINNAVQYTRDEKIVKSDVTDLGVSLGVVFFINKARKRRF